MKNKLMLLWAVAIITANISIAQDCGTKIPKDFFLNINKQQKQALIEPTIPYSTIPDVNLSLSVFVTNKGITMDVLAPAIDSLNRAFEPIGISFSICEISIIQEAEYIDITSNKIENAITTRYNNPNTINLYIVRSLFVEPMENVCGYTYLPSSSALDYVFLSYLCSYSSTLIHEMGHFFGLLHPHETTGGKELVNGTNCSSAGDLICDTEASPNLSKHVTDCEYTGNFIDANGDYYLPTVSNYMAYSPSMCHCKFTPEQYNRMVKFYWTHKSHLR